MKVDTPFYIVSLILAVLKIFELITMPWWVIVLVGFTPLLMLVFITVCVVVLVDLFRK